MSSFRKRAMRVSVVSEWSILGVIVQFLYKKNNLQKKQLFYSFVSVMVVTVVFCQILLNGQGWRTLF